MGLLSRWHSSLDDLGGLYDIIQAMRIEQLDFNLEVWFQSFEERPFHDLSDFYPTKPKQDILLDTNGDNFHSISTLNTLYLKI